MPIKVAIVGSGISGLAAAHALRGKAEVTLFEGGSYFGGHTHTVDVTLPTAQGPVKHGVDTGFLVLNERTYPQLIALFAELGVPTAKSDMSFSVQAHDFASGRDIEWSGSSLGTVFAQRANLTNVRFWGMLRDLLRFNALTTRIARQGTEEQLAQPLGAFLKEHKFGDAFCDWYFLPMMACIWSCPTAQMLQFPVSTMVRFCHNHGLLQVTNRPQWWTVQGGARQLCRPNHRGHRQQVPEHTDRAHRACACGRWPGHGAHPYRQWQCGVDRVIIATHSDQALGLLSNPNANEREILVRFNTSPTARCCTPMRPCYLNPKRHGGLELRALRCAGATLQPCLSALPVEPAAAAAMGAARAGEPESAASDCSRQGAGRVRLCAPVFDLAAVAAQRRMPSLQGSKGRYYAGAWMGYGFHEDGLKAGLMAARQLLSDAGITRSAA